MRGKVRRHSRSFRLGPFGWVIPYFGGTRECSLHVPARVCDALSASRGSATLMCFEDTMKTTRTLATAVTIATLTIGAAPTAIAGDQYAFPSASGVQLAITPAPYFAPSSSNIGIGVGSAKLEYGHNSFGRYQPPLPPPGYAFGPQAPFADRLMSHALMVSPYANYAADYSRLFAPNHALNAWTDRVFGIVTGGYGAVDGWTAAAYGLPRAAGPRRRNESAPDLSPMPKFRAHPELQVSPTFDRQVN